MAFLNSIYKALTGKDVEALLQKLSERETEVQELKAKMTSQATTITLQSAKIEELNKNLKESSENLESIKEQLEKVYYVWVVEFNGNHFLLRNLIPLGFPARINREDRCVIIYGDCHKKLSFSIKFVEKYNRDNNKYETTIYERI